MIVKVEDGIYLMLLSFWYRKEFCTWIGVIFGKWFRFWIWKLVLNNRLKCRFIMKYINSVLIEWHLYLIFILILSFFLRGKNFVCEMEYCGNVNLFIKWK